MIALLCCTGVWASSIPGALSGRFTINASGEKVLFSQGNLQYQASTNTWRFATNQYDYIGSANANISDSYTGWIDLFGWATNGLEANTATGKMPYYTGTTDEDYGPSITSGEFDKTIYDWGKAIDDSWHTLSNAEWNYIFAGRASYSSLYGFGRLFGVNGVFLLPDDWSWSETSIATAATAAGFAWSGGAKTFSSNIISNNTLWSVMESAGAVFIPAAGYRQGTTINMPGDGGDYWSSTASSDKKAYRTSFYNEHLSLSNNYGRSDGISVRLVRSSLEKDAEGNYLLSSADDWKDFAAIVNSGTNPAANAKMTADIDLGGDQTKIGDFDVAYAYGGIFDGQGHTLNVNYYSTSSIVAEGYTIAPFRNIKGATIKNLTVTGSITGYRHPAGVVGYTVSPSTNLISNVTVSATINIVESYGGGFIGHCETSTTTIQDCLFNGTINGKAGGSVVGVFFANSNGASMFLTNCLENGSYTNCSTFSPTSCPTGGTTAVTNCHYTVSGSYSGTHATSAQLADGTIAYKLQNNRGDLVWGQRIGTDAKPVLTNDENYRVYRGKNDYTNSSEEAYEGIQQDGEGNYLLGCLSDWQDFAEIVNSGTNPAANAKMTADIDLGDDQTKIGSFSGIFDGQGHTITINLSTTEQYVGLFCNITDATINNLHVTGAITTNTRFVGGMVGRVYGTSTIQNCWSSVDVTTTYGGDGVQGGMIGCVNGTLNISDCLYDGALNGSSAYTWGGFVGWLYGTTNISNCLFASDEINVRSSDTATHVAGGGNITNCYYKNVMGTAQGTQATSEQLSDGTIATALQNGRAEEVWVQDPLTNQPMLAVFAGKYTVPASGLGTFSAKANFTLPEGLDAYYCKDYADGKISVRAINGAVPANTGVLLKGEPGETYTLTGTNGEAASVTGNALVAVTEQTVIYQIVEINEVEYTNFGLSGGVFKKVNSKGGTVKANRAYLQIPTSALNSAAEAQGIMLVWDEETDGIEIVQTSTVKPQHDDAWFTLDGRQLSGKPTAKGLYIVNGKKVIIK